MNTEETTPAAPAEEQPPAVEDREALASEAPASAEESPAEEPAPGEEEKPAEPEKKEEPFRLRSGPTYEEQRAKLVEEVESCEARVTKHRGAMKKAARTVAELTAHGLDAQNAIADYKQEDASWQNAVDELNCALDELRSCDANPERFGIPAAEESAAPEEPAPWDGSSVEFLDVPEEEYHDAARRREFTSSHYLALYRKCPALYRQEMLGIAPRKDSAAFALGRAAHVAILQGEEAFKRQFLVDDGPINERTGKPFAPGTKAWEEHFAGEARTVVSTADFGTIKQMCASVVEHSAAMSLLVAGRAEGTIRVPDFCGLPCQIRIDWFNPQLGIVDLKTCSDLDRFVWDAKDFDYVYQMAFYRQVLAAAFPQASGAPVHVVAVEKQRPFRCGVWEVSPESLSKAAAENADALRRLGDSLSDSGSWPTGFETVRTLSL
jgi:hypothetical protein